MNVYVGGTFSRYEEVREIIDCLNAMGHRCTHDWTRTDAFGPDGHPVPESGGGYHLPADEQRAHAQDDLAAVKEADLLIMLASEASCGWPIEVGAALAHDHSDVWIVAPFKPTVFWHLPRVTVFASVDDMLASFFALAE